MPASTEPLASFAGGSYKTPKLKKAGEQQGLPVGHVRAFKVRPFF